MLSDSSIPSVDINGVDSAKNSQVSNARICPSTHSLTLTKTTPHMFNSLTSPLIVTVTVNVTTAALNSQF